MIQKEHTYYPDCIVQGKFPDRKDLAYLNYDVAEQEHLHFPPSNSRLLSFRPPY